MAGSEGGPLSMALVCREGSADDAGRMIQVATMVGQDAPPTRTHAAMTCEDLEFTLISFEQEIRRVEKTKDMLTAEVAENRKMVAKMKAHVAELNKESREKDANLQECQRRLAESKENAHCLQSDKNSLLAERDQLLRERDEALSKLYAAETTLKSKETEIRALASKLESTQKRLLLLEDANAALKGANEKLVSCTKSLEAQLGDLRSSQERKTEEIGSLRRAVTQLQAEQEATEKLKTVSAAQSEKLLAELARANLRYELEHQSLVGAGKTLKRVEDERNTLNATATGLKQELEGLRKEKDVASATLQASLDQEKTRFMALEKEKGERITDLLKQIEEVKTSRDGEQQRCAKLQQQLENLEAAMATEKANGATAASDAGKKLADLEAEKAELGAKLDAAEEKAGLLSADLSKLQEAVTGLEMEKSALHEAVEHKEKELAHAADQLQQAMARATELEAASAGLKQAAASQAAQRQQELHGKLREITKQNAAAMAQMKKQFEQQVSVHVAAEKKKAVATVEEAQKKVKEEQAKLGSLLKRQESKHAAALEDLKKQHAGQLDGLLAQLKTHEQEMDRSHAEKDALLQDVATLSEKLQSYEQEHMAKRQALEAESSKAKESYVELEIEVRKLRKEKEEDASQLAALQQHWEARLAEAAVRVKEAESRSVSQRERDMQSLKHLQVELEKALGTEKQRSSILEKKLKESQQQLEATKGDVKQQYEEQLQQAEEAARKLEEELASVRAETEGTLGRLTMQHENLTSKLKMDQEDLMRKLQAEHESTLRQLALDHESAIKRLKIDHESDLATLRMEHKSATRKLQLEHKQDSNLKAAQASQKGDPDSKKRSAQRKPRLQPISSSDNEEVVIQDKDRKKKRTKHPKDDAIVFNAVPTASVSTLGDDPFDL